VEAQRQPVRRTGPRAALALIGSRSFGPYFAGNALSATGTWFQALAAQLLIWRQTHSGLLLGVLAFATFAPLLVLTPWTGAVADRLDRRRVVMATQVIQSALAAALAALAASELAPTAVVIAISFAIGSANAFASPAATAMIASLVPREELPSAVALNSMTWNLARVVGPPLAALTVEALGIAAAFALNAASFFALFVGVALVSPRRQERAVATGVRDGLRLLRANPDLVLLLATVAVVGFASDPVNTLAPAFANAFGRPDTAAGLIVGIFGGGAVVAAFLLSGRIAGSRRRSVVTLLVLVGGVTLFSVLHSFPAALAALAVGGFGYLATNTSATSQLQLGVAEHERGRMMALWSLAFLGLRPLASLVDGAIAAAFGARTAGVALQAPAVALALLLVALASSRLGGRGRPAPLETRRTL
jgi:MFS family permease